jgi:hypothetical protein
MYFISVFYFFNFAYCYFYKTHMYLGDFLSYNLINTNYSFVKNMNRYINVSNLGEASVWADKVKRSKEYNWSKNQHYIDLPSSLCNKINGIDLHKIYTLCENDCIFTSFLNITNSIKYNKLHDPDVITDDIKFLIHYFQDFFQPMHVFGDYRGGNDFTIKLVFGKKQIKTNLHTLWDKYIPEYYISKNSNQKILNDIIIKNHYSMNEYTEYLLNNTIEMFALACYSTKFINRSSNIVIFEKYYDHQIIEQIFINYLTFAVNTLYFIFN